MIKKKITVGELKSYYASKKLSTVRFSTENQKWYRVSDPCKVNLSFSAMLITENPNLICLKSGVNTICFDRVKFVEIDTESSVLGTIITLFCGDFGSNDYDITYRLVAA